MIDAEATRDGLQSDVKNLDETITSLRTELNTAQTSLKHQEEKSSSMEETLSVTTLSLSTAKDTIAKLLVERRV